MSAERRKLTAVDDPLAFGSSAPPGAPTRTVSAATGPPAAATSRNLPALFVRLPVVQSEALARAAFELKVHKRELVAALVSQHVRTTPDGLAELRELVERHREQSE